MLLSAPLSRRRLVAADLLATAVELAAVLAITLALTELGSAISGAGLSFGSALAGFANVWPLGLLARGLGVVATGFSLRTSVVTGAVAGVLVAMYIVDLAGRLDTSLNWTRYGSVFRYYGNAIEDGIDPLAFAGVVTAAAHRAGAIGAICSTAAISPDSRHFENWARLVSNQRALSEAADERAHNLGLEPA